MTRSQEIICTLFLILFAVQCGNWHLEAKCAKAFEIAVIRYGGDRMMEAVDTLKNIGAI